jgi:hypothetical protein
MTAVTTNTGTTVQWDGSSIEAPMETVEIVSDPPPEDDPFPVLASSSPLDCYGFVRGKTIRVETHCWDPADPPPPAPAGEVHLGDRLDAQALTFVVP